MLRVDISISLLMHIRVNLVKAHIDVENVAKYDREQ